MHLEVNKPLLLKDGRPAWIVTESGCWEWQGHKDDRGYGRYRGPAHRTLYKLANGADSVLKGWHLHHLCENPPCVNPAHLEPHSPRSHRAEHLIFGRGLTWDDYREMRRLIAEEHHLSYQEIGKRYGVDMQTVYHVAAGWHWPDLGGPVVLAPRTCGRHGCANSMEGRPRHAVYCTKECRVKANRDKPANKAKAADRQRRWRQERQTRAF